MIPSREVLMEMYRKMLLIRASESRLKDMFEEGEIKLDAHLCIGQEAVSVGVCAGLRKDDYVIGTHRGHGQSIAKGVEVRSIWAELFGRRTGCCKGKGGSLHLADFSIGMLGCNGVVGAGLPLAVGAALSIKLKGTDQVAVGFFGDGACAQGTFHESLNLASIWKLPVVFVCENNLYGNGTHTPSVLSARVIADVAVSYNMPGIVVDGNDAVGVYSAASEAIYNARKGDGPTLMECRTYRWEGHMLGDLQFLYRSEIEVEEWKKKCPIQRLREKLLEIVKEQDIKEIEEWVVKEIEDAVEYAKESPWPSPEEAFEDVFCGC